MEDKKIIAEQRKLIQTGGSVSITLPPEWLIRNGLKAGDYVGVVANGILKIVPANEIK